MNTLVFLNFQWAKINLKYLHNSCLGVTVSTLRFNRRQIFVKCKKLFYLCYIPGLFKQFIKTVINKFAKQVDLRILVHKYNCNFFSLTRSVFVDPGSSTDIFCHTTPFLLYNIVYSCGPDIQKCCKNDFTSSKCWQWGKYVKATEINEENVKER